MEVLTNLQTQQKYYNSAIITTNEVTGITSYPQTYTQHIM